MHLNLTINISTVLFPKFVLINFPISGTIHDLGALVEFASLGTFCEYDLFGIEVSHYQLETSTDMPSDAQRVQRIKHLVDNGFEDKILIAHDIHTLHRMVRWSALLITTLLINELRKPKFYDVGADFMMKKDYKHSTHWRLQLRLIQIKWSIMHRKI